MPPASPCASPALQAVWLGLYPSRKRARRSAAADGLDIFGEADLPFAPQPLGVENGDHRLHRLADVMVDDDVVVLGPVAHLIRRLGHAPAYHVFRILGAGAQPPFQLAARRRQNEHRDEVGAGVLAQLLGPSRRTFDWLLTPLGVFFAALPGFIVGYNTVGDGGIRTAPAIYGTVLASAAASFIAAAAIVILFRLNAKKALPVLAALAGGIYYWFAGPSIAQHFGVGAPVALTIRGLGIGIVVWWVVTLAPRRNRSSAGSI